MQRSTRGDEQPSASEPSATAAGGGANGERSAHDVRSAANEATHASSDRLPADLVGSALLTDQAWSAIARSLDLSGREVQIARAVLDDRKEVAVAEELGIAPRTVHTHVERLYRKLGVSDHSQLLARLFREYLRLITSPHGSLPPICRHEADGKCPLHPPRP